MSIEDVYIAGSQSLECGRDSLVVFHRRLHRCVQCLAREAVGDQALLLLRRQSCERSRGRHARSVQLRGALRAYAAHCAHVNVEVCSCGWRGRRGGVRRSRLWQQDIGGCGGHGGRGGRGGGGGGGGGGGRSGRGGLSGSGCAVTLQPLDAPRLGGVLGLALLVDLALLEDLARDLILLKLGVLIVRSLSRTVEAGELRAAQVGR